MKVKNRMTIRWQPNRLRKFTQLCAPADVSKAARDILEAWLACKIAPEERAELGLIPEWQKTEPALLTDAIESFRRAG